MKACVLISIFILSTVFVQAQTYKSIFSADTTKWYIHECIPDGGSNHMYFSLSDTTFDQKIYHKIFKSFWQDTALMGYIYEDSTGKYRFRKLVKGKYKEAIFMDLNLDVGDTFPMINDFRYMWVDSAIVDSVYYKDNRKVVSIKYDHCDLTGNYGVKFIEGVGPTNGFYMAEFYEQPHPYSLLCKFNGDDKVYQHSSSKVKNCMYQVVGISDYNSNKSFEIFPNPSSRIITVRPMGSHVNCEYLVYNSQGILVDKGNIKGKNTRISIENSGMYFITFISKDFSHTEKVFILNK